MRFIEKLRKILPLSESLSNRHPKISAAAQHCSWAAVIMCEQVSILFTCWFCWLKNPPTTKISQIGWKQTSGGMTEVIHTHIHKLTRAKSRSASSLPLSPTQQYCHSYLWLLRIWGVVFDDTLSMHHFVSHTALCYHNLQHSSQIWKHLPTETTTNWLDYHPYSTDNIFCKKNNHKTSLCWFQLAPSFRTLSK